MAEADVFISKKKKKNELLFALQHSFFGDKDKSKQNFLTIQNVSHATANILIGIARFYMVPLLVTKSSYSRCHAHL